MIFPKLKIGLRQRLLISFLGLAIIPLVIAALVVSWNTYRGVVGDSYKQQQQLAKRVRVEVESMFHQFETILLTKLNISGFERLDTAGRTKVLEGILAQRNLFQDAYFINTKQKVEISLSNVRIASEVSGISRHQELVFREAIRSTGVYYGSVYFDQSSNEPLITIGVPVFDRITGKGVGIVSVDLKFKSIWHILSSKSIADGEDMYILDSHGRVVAHPKPSMVLRDSRISVTDQQVQDGLNQNDVVIAIERFEVGNREFTVVVERAHRIAIARAIEQLWNLLPISIVTIVIALLLFLFVSRYLLRPVSTISQTAKAIRDGDWRRQVMLKQDDELGEMAEAFNSMIGRLTNTVVSLETENQQRALAEKKLEEANERLETLTQFESDWIYWRSDDEKTFYYISPTCQDFTGYSVKEFEDDPSLLEKVIHPDDRERWDNHAHIRDLSGNSLPEEYRIITKSGEVRWISHTCRPVIKENNETVGRRGSNQDITVRKKNEEDLMLSASVFTHAREGIVITNANGDILDVNNAFENITGYRRTEVIGKNPRILKSNQHEDDFYKAMWTQLNIQGSWSGEIWNRRKNGDIYPELLTISSVSNNRGETVNYVGLFSDISQIKEQQKKLEYIAHYDALTLLPNRLLLADRLHQAMSQTIRRGKQLAVVYLDLDGFKDINDRHGHDIGDHLLMTIASRMKDAVRDGDTVARLGGDEFVAVLVDLENSQSSIPLIKRLIESASKAVNYQDLCLKVTASLGVTFYPQQEDMEADQLLRQADQAMYQAKLSGKNRYHLFDAEKDRDVRGRHESIENIRQGLIDNEFILYYQPKVNMRTGEVVGAEALVRWQHPEQGLLSPIYFLPVIEGHDLSLRLDERVITLALKQIENWQAIGLNIPVSVNISAYQLQQKNFSEVLRSTLKKYPRVKASNLVIEVLETSALDDINHVSSVIEECHKEGIHFALDDFGTGYSSLTYLKRLPASELKIDQSFVRDMLDDPEDLAILDGVIGLARAFRRTIIAEGVESIEHGQMLLFLGCDIAQGYAIARPMPADEFLKWNANWKQNTLWKNAKVVAQKDLPVLFAMTEHRAWVRNIEDCLKDIRQFAYPLNEHECEFGQWFYSEVLQRKTDNSYLTHIDELHQQVHHLSKELLELKKVGKSEEAIVRLDELYNLRDRLVNSLKEYLKNNE